MKKQLAPEALYTSQLYHEHRIRARWRPDGLQMLGDASDVESPESCWDRAAARMRRLDPDGARARALLEEIRRSVRS